MEMLLPTNYSRLPLVPRDQGVSGIEVHPTGTVETETIFSLKPMTILHREHG